jgi:hypothetical protein
MMQASSIKTGFVKLFKEKPTAIGAFAPKMGIQLKAGISNTGVVYIGDRDVSNTGYPLEPGEPLFLPLSSTRLLFAIAEKSDDLIHYIVLS